MVFSTVIFLCFFLPFVICVYYLTPKQGKNLFLLLSSLCFYAFGEPKYVLIMLTSIIGTYVLGFLIAGKHVTGTVTKIGEETAEAAKASEPQKGSKLWLTLAVVFHLGILGTFKYAGFFAENLAHLIPGFPIPQIALPIGISFYTFQGLSYCIDVYRDPSLKQKKILNVALYISMFPQLIAGPIVRYTDIRQDLDVRTHSADRFAKGAMRFINGLAKKAILANSMGQLADSVMGGNLQTMSASVAWLGAIAYTLQIYFDFSGYSDMAIGLGHIFGFRFPENFDHPYISKSITEFWRRWHMTLSAWFRDYVYIPLGGNRTGNVYVNLLIVFLVTGLWHGAAWGFVLWGLWHGFFVLAERFILRNAKGKRSSEKEPDPGEEKQSGRPWAMLKGICGHVYTMFIVCLGWVLFKLVSVRDTAEYISVMFGRNANAFHAFDVRYFLTGRTVFLFAVAILACLPVKDLLKKLFVKKRADGNEEGMSPLFTSISYAAALILLALSFMFIITGTYNPFIYFRF
ncbi:MAG: MBOAT family protein [Lachnospiraceae bacterium]|nr:MBOAT family protein [Lachnospiraceae bacterium]